MNYEKEAKQARIKVLEMIYKAQTSHIGSNFSAIDIMTVLFDKVDPSKDEVILSAGWKAAAWYYFLNKKGILTDEELNSFCQPDSPFIGLVEPMNRWGLRCAGGSMGMGLPFGVGFALAKKLNKEEGKVYVLMSDGEMQCGTTWESAQIAKHHHLDNLMVIVDMNGFQAMGETTEILDVDERDVFSGWCRQRMNGHDFDKLKKGLSIMAVNAPTVNFIHTIKGKGVSFMENNNLYHYKAPSKEEYELALKELECLK